MQSFCSTQCYSCRRTTNSNFSWFPLATALSPSFDNIILFGGGRQSLWFAFVWKSSWIHSEGTGGGTGRLSFVDRLESIPSQRLIQLLEATGERSNKCQLRLSGRCLILRYVSLLPSGSQTGEYTEVWFHGPLAELLNRQAVTFSALVCSIISLGRQYKSQQMFPVAYLMRWC